MEVAAPWFELHKLSNDITLIREPHVLGGAFTNMWHVRGRDCDLLLDSGMGVLSLKQHVAALSEKPVVCVASHAHYDHIGGHHEFDQRVVHAEEADNLRSADPAQIVLDGWRDSSFDALPYVGFDIEIYSVRGVEPTRTVNDGDVIDLGDRHFDVWHLPGHSPGSIALWEAATSTLLSGDIITQGQLLDDLHHSSPDAYVESLSRIRPLEIDTVLPGHYEPFGRPEFVELIDRYVTTRKKPACPGAPG